MKIDASDDEDAAEEPMREVVGRVPVSLKKKLRAIKVVTGKNMEDQVREALETYVDEHDDVGDA